MPGAAVLADGVWKAFDGRGVLRGASVEVAPGETVGLLGPNGAGKSTLLRVLGARSRPDRGTVRVAGIDAARDPARARAHVRLVEQHAPLLEELPALDHVRLLAAAHGERLGPRDARDQLEAWGLARKADARAADLSRGQRQRLALLGAWPADGGEVALLLDEPFTALDADGQALLEGRLAERRGRAATVLALHDEAQARRLCDRLLRLRAGTLEEA